MPAPAQKPVVYKGVRLKNSKFIPFALGVCMCTLSFALYLANQPRPISFFTPDHVGVFTRAKNYFTTALGGRRNVCSTSDGVASHMFRNNTIKKDVIDYVAVCLAVKDEHTTIREWLTYHYMTGIRHFYVYDDRSEPPLQPIIQDFIDEGIVTYKRLVKPLRHRKPQQLQIYEDCIRNHAGKHSWLGAWDADEFLLVMDGSSSVQPILAQYEPYGGLVVNWRIFGSSGHMKRQSGILQSYTKCTEESLYRNGVIKSLANTRYVLKYGQNPHQFRYKDGYYAVNTNCEMVDSTHSRPPLNNVLRLNHYVLRSREEFEEKMERGSAMGNHKKEELWSKVEAAATHTCTYAVPWGLKVQEALAKVPTLGLTEALNVPA